MATWKKIITSGSNAELAQITASVGIKGTGTDITGVKTSNLSGTITNSQLAGSIANDKLANDGITIAGADTSLGGSITADTIAGQISADTISGNQINGGTIGSITISALAGDLSLGDNNITNVGDINADSISVDAAGTGLNIDFSGGDTTTNKITLQDNLGDALNITEGSNSYIKFITSNSSEEMLFGEDATFEKNVSGSFTSTGSFGHLLVSDLSQPNLLLLSQSISSRIEAAAANDGDITSVIAGDGLKDGGNTGAVTLNIDVSDFAGDGLEEDGSTENLKVSAAQTTIESIINSSLGKIGTAADQEYIDFGTSNEVNIKVNNTERLSVDNTGVVVTGNLTVNGTTTTVDTTNTQLKDQFLLLASGSSATNVDAGIIVQSGSVPGTGSAFYHDQSDERWSVAKSISSVRTEATAPTQFVTTVKTDTVNPDTTSGSYGAGEMHVNTTTGEIWIRFG